MRSDAEMNAVLKSLLERLEEIGEVHEDLYDTHVRDPMGDAVIEGFVVRRPGFVLPSDYETASPEASELIRGALDRYIDTATRRAVELGLNAEERLAAFQCDEICTDGERQYADDFFGWYSAVPS
ncbi:MAG: hypothetical protein AAF517_06010 [Planctomycetota bacterium]